MGPKLFLTGVTGFIGGDIFYSLYKKHPEWEYTLLVRSEDKANEVRKSYPEAKFAFGDLDNSEVIKEEAAKADIVVHTADASDHEGAAKAIAEGLASGHSQENPGYWIHTSGTGILCFSDSDAERYGEATDKVYDDWENVTELTNLPDHAFHRNVDKVVLEAGIGSTDKIKTAIVCPPTIYGTGRGPVSRRSRQVPGLVDGTLKLKKGPVIGAGKTYWNNVHVHDLSDLYVLLAEAAANRNTDTQIWGANGYFLAENGEHVWGQLSKAIAKVAADKGYIPAADTQPMSKDEALDFADFQALSWGLNSRATAKRAKKVLNWNPHAPKLEDTLSDLVQSEWERQKSQ